MANSNNILQELTQISPLVAELNAGTPFQIPQYYFEGLAEQILNRVNILEEMPSFLGEATVKIPFSIPNHYFQNLADTVLSRIQAIEAGSPLEELEALSPILVHINKKIPFDVPSGYFQELSLDVLAGASAIDFVNRQFDPVSPVLIEAKDINVYTVPSGYFDRLQEQVLKKIRFGQRPAVISMKVSRRLLRYAAAAVITGIIAAGAWFFTHSQRLAGSAEEFAAITKLTDDEIVNYLDNSSISISETNSIASVEMKQEDITELLSDVSDQELQQYLDQHALAKEETIN